MKLILILIFPLSILFTSCEGMKVITVNVTPENEEPFSDVDVCFLNRKGLAKDYTKTNSLGSVTNKLITQTISMQLAKTPPVNYMLEPHKITIPKNSLDTLYIIDTKPNRFKTESFDFVTCLTKPMWELMISCGIQSGCDVIATEINYILSKNKIALPLKNMSENIYLIDISLNNKSMYLEVQIE
tara:strand:- start:295 stop:849 length:555 start_codon:yes stop_codon:yes gene_type:complete